MTAVNVASSLAAILLLTAGSARACDRVDYAEAKDWSTPKLERAYCDAVQEAFDRLKDKLDGVADFSRQDQRQCAEQKALYKRLLEARDKEPNCRKQ